MISIASSAFDETVTNRLHWLRLYLENNPKMKICFLPRGLRIGQKTQPMESWTAQHWSYVDQEGLDENFPVPDETWAGSGKSLEKHEIDLKVLNRLNSSSYGDSSSVEEVHDHDELSQIHDYLMENQDIRICFSANGMSWAKGREAITGAAWNIVKFKYIQTKFPVKVKKQQRLKELEIAGKKVKLLGRDSTIEDFVTSGMPLGRGAFGQVYQGTLLVDIVAPDGSEIPKGVKVAVKSQSGVDEKKLQSIGTEIASLKTAMAGGCTDVNKVYDILYNAKAKTIYFIMELIRGKALHDFEPAYFTLKREDWLLKHIILPLITGLECLHRNGIAHRDIKGDNIMWDQDSERAKWIDLGLSCLDTCRVGRIAGNLGSQAPEVMLNEVFDYSINSWIQADIWGFGCIIYRLLRNKYYPFQYKMGTLKQKLKQKQRKGNERGKMRALMAQRAQYGLNLPKKMKDRYPKIAGLLRNCLQLDPCDRRLGF